MRSSFSCASAVFARLTRSVYDAAFIAYICISLGSDALLGCYGARPVARPQWRDGKVGLVVNGR
jgi:hypothetical protein